MADFSNNSSIDFANPPEITFDDVTNNMTAVGLNQQALHLSQLMPSHVFKAWWEWLDDHGGDSDNNVITNQELDKYYRKKKLWDNDQSYAVVTKLDEDYTVVVHDKLPHADSLLVNFIMLPMGAI